jgi:hypothetical protein
MASNKTIAQISILVKPNTNFQIKKLNPKPTLHMDTVADTTLSSLSDFQASSMGARCCDGSTGRGRRGAGALVAGRSGRRTADSPVFRPPARRPTGAVLPHVLDLDSECVREKEEREACGQWPDTSRYVYCLCLAMMGEIPIGN